MEEERREGYHKGPDEEEQFYLKVSSEGRHVKALQVGGCQGSYDGGPFCCYAVDRMIKME